MGTASPDAVALPAERPRPLAGGPLAAELTANQPDTTTLAAAIVGVEIAVARGDGELLARCFRLASADYDTTDVSMRSSAAIVLAHHALAERHPDRALNHALPVLDGALDIDMLEPAYAVCVHGAIIAAHADPATLDGLAAHVDALPPVRATPLLLAGRARLRAARVHQAGDSAAAEHHHAEAADLYRQVGARPLLAQALIEHHDRTRDPAALAEAREILGELGATAPLTAPQPKQEPRSEWGWARPFR